MSDVHPFRKLLGWLPDRIRRAGAAAKRGEPVAGAAAPPTPPVQAAQGRPWVEAFLHNPRGVALVDPESNTFRAVNTAYAHLVGCTPEELQGKPVSSLYPATEFARVRESERCADLEGYSTVQTCQIHRDGTLVPVEVTLVSVRNESDAVITRIATVTDLRERLHVEGELRHAEARLMAADRFRQLADSAPIGILLMDTDSSCYYANPCWVRITGHDLERVRGSGWWDAIHPEDRPRAREAWERMTRGALFEMELRYRRDNGDVRWVHSRAEPLRDDSGARIGYISVNIDISEQRQQRAAMDQFHERVRSLARRLQNLREEERAHLAHKLHGSLRHDLTTLKVEIDTLCGGVAAGAPSREVLGNLAEVADRCLNNLRHVTFELQPPGIEDLGFVGAVKRYAEEWSGETGIAVHVAAHEALPSLGNRRHLVLYRTFQEALTNVYKHARARSVTVQLTVHDGSLRLRMSDDGVGMGDGDRNKPGAFGLLAASERLSEVGGTLRVLGVAGEGTTLDARVPLRRVGRKRDAAER
jgi:PAS domain S-box-containing protein